MGSSSRTCRVRMARLSTIDQSLRHDCSTVNTSVSQTVSIAFCAAATWSPSITKKIYRLSIIDGLTGCYNQRYMLEFLDRELARSARHRRPLTLAMIDIDHLSKSMMNMATWAATLHYANSPRGSNSHAREDLMCRYGGEEFGLVLVKRHSIRLDKSRTEFERLSRIMISSSR